MSIISEIANRLKVEAEWLGKDQEKRLAIILLQAADTIEFLSAKLQAANMERSADSCDSEWITDRSPEKSGFYFITTDSKDGTVESRIASWDGEEWYVFEEVYAWKSIKFPKPYRGAKIHRPNLQENDKRELKCEQELREQMSEKEKLIEYIKNPILTNARNRMGCDENWYNSYYAIKETFSAKEIEIMSEEEIENLVRLAYKISDALY